MYKHDTIRFHLIAARGKPAAERDRRIPELMADALVDARKLGDATERTLMERYGFTRDEIRKHETAAKDQATERWAATNLVDA
jgi:hypothetical protein